MKKGLLITTTGEIRAVALGEPLHRSLGALVGGLIEHVKPCGLENPYCMIVNEEGLLKQLPINIVSSWLYGTDLHGQPIVGDIVIMKDGKTESGEWDILGLDDQELRDLAMIMHTIRRIEEERYGTEK